jgi:site-specific DNA-methyltransferase (adenine-specific)
VINLINDDCLKVLPTISDKSIDLILTDPPYGTTQCKWDNVIPFELMWKELKRIIKDNGCIALFGTEPFSSNLRLSNLSWFKYDWFWQKSHPTGFLNAYRQPLRTIELISIFYNKQVNYNPQIEDKKPNKVRPYKKLGGKNAGVYSKNGYQVGGIIKLSNKKTMPKNLIYFSSSTKKIHPTQKPVALLEYLIKTYTNENDNVLDFTMGSGSTGVACKNTNRNFIGIELDKEYFKIAENRINSAFI